MEDISKIVELANLGTNGILVAGMFVLWRKLNAVLLEKDEAHERTADAHKQTVEILRELMNKPDP